MDNGILLDIYMFLTSTYGGLIGGLIYDLYRSLRLVAKPKKLIGFFLDSFFWLILTGLFFYILIKINWGELRGFIIVGFILGIILYIKIFSRFIFPFSTRILNFIFGSFHGLYGWMVLPLKFLRTRSSYFFKKLDKIRKERKEKINKRKKIISSKK